MTCFWRVWSKVHTIAIAAYSTCQKSGDLSLVLRIYQETLALRDGRVVAIDQRFHDQNGFSVTDINRQIEFHVPNNENRELIERIIGDLRKSQVVTWASVCVTR